MVIDPESKRALIAIGSRLRQKRKSLGITGVQLAERTGVVQSQISRYERGEVATLGPAFRKIVGELFTNSAGNRLIKEFERITRDARDRTVSEAAQVHRAGVVDAIHDDERLSEDDKALLSDLYLRLINE
jgi:transcriptional regulator with XRE-family HTH domain